MTIEETLRQLQLQIIDLIEAQKYAEIKPKFKLQQAAWTIKYFEWATRQDSFYIKDENQLLSDSLEEAKVNSITLSMSDGKIIYNYNVNRYYQAPNNLTDDQMFLSKAEAIEALQEKFNQAIAKFAKEKQDIADRKVAEARKLLGLE